MSTLLSDLEIQNEKKIAITKFSLSIIADIEECAKQEDAPLYKGDKEVDYFVRLSEIKNIINKNLNELIN